LNNNKNTLASYEWSIFAGRSLYKSADKFIRVCSDLCFINDFSVCVKKCQNYTNIFVFQVLKGKALIINNEFFDDPNYDRLGSSADVKNFGTLLQQFKFDVSTIKANCDRYLLDQRS